VPNGTIGLKNDTANRATEISKIYPDGKTKWVYRLESDDYILMGGIVDSRIDGHVIKFFNASFGEPGEIHLDHSYDFDCLCQEDF